VLTTRDGVQWDIISLTNAPPLHGVTSDNDRFIVVGERGAIWVSTDGSFWSNRSVALQRGDEGFNTVTSGNGFYVAAGNVIALSTNGWDWSLQTGPLPTTVSRMLFADGIFVAASPGTTSLGPRILTSTNGLEWTVRYVRPGPSYSAPVGNIAHGNGTFLAWCGSCLRSTDGIEWQSVDSPLLAAFSGIYADQPPALEFFHGRFLIAGPFGQILQSDDTFVPALNPRSSAVGFRFSFSPKAGDSYRIQNSLNLSDWRTVDESLGDGGTNEFIDMSEATMPHRFFRVVSP